VTNDLLKVKIY